MEEENNENDEEKLHQNYVRFKKKILSWEVNVYKQFMLITERLEIKKIVELIFRKIN